MSLNVFSIEGIVAWLERQDPETEYDFTDPDICLATQYFESLGVKRSDAFNYGPIDLEGNNLWTRVIHGDPWTYGAALKRAREILKESHTSPNHLEFSK